MTSTQIHSRTRMNRTRRTALALLGAAAVLLASVATPLTDAAYAGGKGGVSGDPPESRPPPKPKMVIGNPTPTIGLDTVENRPGAETIETLGRKPGASGGSGGIEILGRKPGASGGAGANDPPTRPMATATGAIGESEPDAGSIETLGSKKGASGAAGVQDPPDRPQAAIAAARGEGEPGEGNIETLGRKPGVSGGLRAIEVFGAKKGIAPGNLR